MQLAAVELGELDALVALHLLEEEAAEQLDGVGTLLIDVVARVSADEAFQRAFDEERTFGCCLTLEGELGRRITSASTTDEDLALVLRVEVDQVVARHEAGLHAFGTGQPGLLVAGEDALDGPVLDIVRAEDGQFDSAADTVVGTEGGAFGRQPFTIHISLDGILVEIELHIDELVAHHVHVTLQDDGLPTLHTLGGRLADDHVACLVDLRLQAVALAPVLQVLNHLLFALRGTRNLVNLRKFGEDNSRF